MSGTVIRYKPRHLDEQPQETSGELFGDFLRRMRKRWRVPLDDIEKLLPKYLSQWGEKWNRVRYNRIENGRRAPQFDELLPIFQLLLEVGVLFDTESCYRYVKLARIVIEQKETRREERSDRAWTQLHATLVQVASHHQGPFPSFQDTPFTSSRLDDTSHIVGRETWLQDTVRLMQSNPVKKLIVVQGPPGIGKSSALNLLFRHLSSETDFSALYFPGPATNSMTAEDYLNQILATVLTAVTVHPGDLQALSPTQRIDLIIRQLARAAKRVALLVDQAEIILQENGALTSYWQQFLAAFVQGPHRSSLVLATREWPVWTGKDRSFIEETYLPALPPEIAASIWRRLGFSTASEELVERVCGRCGGNSGMIELRAATLKRRLAYSWDSGEVTELPGANDEDRLLQTLLGEPHVFDDTDVEAQELLQQVISRRLSQDAERLLEVLSAAVAPLAFPLLARICQNPTYAWKELQRASLVDIDAMMYARRARLLPIVTEAGIQRLTSKERLREAEYHVITLYREWLKNGTLQKEEAGAVVTELAVLLLKHEQLLEAAQLLLRYASFSFRLGHATRIARVAEEEMQRFDWGASVDNEYGGLLLHHFLSPFLGKSIERKRETDYRHIHNAILARKIVLQPSVEVHVTHILMLHAMNGQRFEEAQAILNVCYNRLQPQQESNVDLKASLVEKRAWLLSRWSEYAEEQRDVPSAKAHREQAIALYRECSTLLSADEEPSPLRSFFLKKRLARVLNYLGYHLSRTGWDEEALEALEQSRVLQEEGYAEVDSLPPLYGDTSQTLAALGRFREALHFDEQAYVEAQRLASAGYTFSQEEIWIYRINVSSQFLGEGKKNRLSGIVVFSKGRGSRKGLPRGG